MIVDDHASTREMIRKFLALPGITFCECASGDEALQRARDFKPNWVTMDVNMPGLNGFQSTAAICAEHPGARVIMVTAYNEPHFRQLSNSAGAIGFIAKENLLALRMMLSNEMAGSTPPLARRTMTTTSDLKRILLADDDTELRTMLGLMLTGEGYKVSHTVCAREAIALHQHQPFDLVITELGINGFETLKELRRHSSPAKLIATSKPGWMPANLCLRMAEHLGAHSVLAKPFQPEEYSMPCATRWSKTKSRPVS